MHGRHHGRENSRILLGMDPAPDPQSVIADVVAATRAAFDQDQTDNLASVNGLSDEARADVWWLWHHDPTFERNLKRELAKVRSNNKPLLRVHLYLLVGGMGIPSSFEIDPAIMY